MAETLMAQMPSLTLNDGTTLPQLGFGLWRVPNETTADTVAGALDLGYRLFDGAFIYGNEAGLGEGLRRSGVPREEVFLTTKVWNSDHGRDRTRASVMRSLDSIGVERLDLVLIHWPVPERGLYVETWEALIEMRDEGLLRAIGVSNFNADHLDAIISATGVAPALNQIELHPDLQQPVMRAANAARGIVTESWTPLGKGRCFGKPAIAGAAEAHGKSPAQVVLRWQVQLGNVVIPRSVNPARQAENLDIFDFALTEAEMAAIAGLDVGLRTGPDPSVYKHLG